jgi:sigma-B regulation protein RsbU (phosphoserine phosphatase)
MKKILVVDDEPDLELLLRQKFRRKMRRREIELVFAGNGVEALDKLNEQEDIDMVLSDINMPEMDGLTLLSQINSLDLDLRAVIVTAYGDMENIRTAMNRGAFDFLTKPINFDDLETTIDKTVRHLEVMREALRSRDELVALRQELGVAAQMQDSILPKTFPKHPQYGLYAWMTPAKEVGGDFYDFFQVEDDRFAVVVADVSGKGVPAALFMMVSRTLVKGSALGEREPVKCITEVNQLLYEQNKESMFVTMFYAVLDPASGLLEYVNGGHNLPCLVKPSGEVTWLPGDSGIVLGVIDEFPYQQHSMQLEEGDVVFFYTDGVTEAMDEAGNQFGDDTLLEVLGKAAGADPEDMTRQVVDAVHEHAGGAPQSDDLTCLALRYGGD